MSKRHTPPKNAVALHYDGTRAPRITAKGRGVVAEEIIELAHQHGVPLHEDRELVTLLAQLELNDEIPRELYLAVAEVIAFAYMVTEKFPPGWGPEGKR